MQLHICHEDSFHDVWRLNRRVQRAHDTPDDTGASCVFMRLQKHPRFQGNEDKPCDSARPDAEQAKDNGAIRSGNESLVSEPPGMLLEECTRGGTW